MGEPPGEKLCDFSLAFPRSCRKPLYALVGRPLERALAVNRINAIYAGLRPEAAVRDTVRDILDKLSIRYRVVRGTIESIAAAGPTVVVANHPFGGIEGLVLADLLLGVRGDTRILANYLLGRIRPCRDLFVLVDPFGGGSAARRNLRPIREAVGWLREGGVLGAFPAGEVAHLRMRSREVTDPRWSPTIGRLVQMTGATVVPVYFEGGNSPLFHAAGMVHPRLRTALLAREVINKAGSEIAVRVGAPIPFRAVEHFPSATELTDYLRVRTFFLGDRNPKRRPVVQPAPPAPPMAAIVAPLDPRLLADEIASLPGESRLIQTGDLSVWCAAAEQIPHLLREIGRLREVTFRHGREGTGLATDLDRFDRLYRHVFIWNAATREVVGAYRLGETDLLVSRHGLGALYTHTLFKYRKGLLRRLGPALEMGRSFVRPEYQRSFSPLLLLWRGIGEFVARNPRYRILFGPVSISSDYHGLSQQLIVSFAKAGGRDTRLGVRIRPRTPFRSLYRKSYEMQLTRRVVKTLDDVSALVAAIENDGKGIPILLRQYLRLGGRILAFNRDPAFSNVLDALVLIDLTRSDGRLLARYMGEEGYAAFLEYHRDRLGRAPCPTPADDPSGRG